MSKNALERRIEALEEAVNILAAALDDLDEENGVNEFRISEVETFVENVKNS